MHTPLRVWFAPFALALASVGLAKTENPLERMTPVPANEPIPLVDFFRPVLFRHPQINDSGTLFAAMVTAGADREELLVYDFATAKFSRLSGMGKKDIYDFDWLDDERLLFAVSSEKRYREGLYVTEARDLGSSYFLDLHNVSLLVARPEAKRLHPYVWIKNSAYHGGRDGGVVQIDAAARVKNPFAESAYFDPSGLPYGTTARVIRSIAAPKVGMPTWYACGVHGDLVHAFAPVDGVERLFRLLGDEWVPLSGRP